jgi:integrase/recombinase XerC
MKSIIQASESHLADCRYRNLSPKTLAHYRTYETLFVDYLAAQGLPLAPNSLNAGNVKAAAEWLGTRGTGGKRDGQFARQAFVGTMKVWSHYLVNEDVLEHDLLARLARPKAITVARRPFEPWEVVAIRGAMITESSTGVRDVAVFSLLLATGMRIGELCRLTLDDVDLVAHVALVHGKGNKQRALRFGDGSPGGGKTAARLRDYLKTRRTPRGKTKVFFLNKTAGGMTVNSYGEAFRNACQRAGITSGTECHRSRHTFATNFLVSHPGDIEGLRYCLGHVSDDEYRNYAGEAGRRLAEMRGDDVGAADMLESEPCGTSPRRGESHGETTATARTPAKRSPAVPPDALQALLAAVKTDPELRRALLRALNGAA